MYENTKTGSLQPKILQASILSQHKTKSHAEIEMCTSQGKMLFSNAGETGIALQLLK